MESFRALFKRGFHRMSSQHLERYVREFAGRHNNGPKGPKAKDTTDQQSALVRGMRGKRRLTSFDSSTFLHDCSLVSA